MEDKAIQLAVFGNPIKQTKSPIIHKMFAEQFALDVTYQAICAPIDSFEQSLSQLFLAKNGIGCNVTTPFKSRASQWVDHLNDEAKKAGSVNTIHYTHGKSYGYTTDGQGLVGDILRQGHSLQNARILIIGAGGAARGVISALSFQQPEAIHLYNRTFANAQVLARIFKKEGVVALTDDDLRHSKYDIIINATTLSLTNQIPIIPDSLYKNLGLAYDMVYLTEPTEFMKQAKRHGAYTVSDGIGMLVGQAAASFRIWFDKTPDVEPVLAYLKQLA